MLIRDSKKILTTFITPFGGLFFVFVTLSYFLKTFTSWKAGFTIPLEFGFLSGIITLLANWQSFSAEKKNALQNSIFGVTLLTLLTISAPNLGIAVPYSILHYVELLACSLIAVLFFLKRKDLAEKFQPEETVAVGWRKYASHLPLVSIVILGLILRAWNLEYVQGADNFNVLSAKAFAENGTFVYLRNLQITYSVGWLFRIFGTTLTIARLPMVLLGTGSIILLYNLSREFINKKIALCASFLLAISPVAIEESSFIREYAELLTWSLLVILTLCKIYKRYQSEPKKFLKLYPLVSVGWAAFLYLYSGIVDTGTVKSGISIIFFISIPIGFYFVKDNYRRLLATYCGIAALALAVFLSVVHIPITMFAPGFVYYNFWYRMFFDPSVQTPMQWFSFSTISPLFFTSIFLLPLVTKNRGLIILQFCFWSIVGLFVFKYFNVLGQYHARYLYYIYPFYLASFGAAAYGLFSVTRQIGWRTITYPVIGIFLISSVFIPQNTGHGAKHDLSIWANVDNERQPTSSGSRNFFLDVVRLLNENGFTNKDAVVIQGESPFYLSWYFDYPLTRTYSLEGAGEKTYYEIGDKVFIVDVPHNTYELYTALSEYQTGYLLWHSNFYPEADMTIGDASFTYLGKSEDYKLYRWQLPPKPTTP